MKNLITNKLKRPSANGWAAMAAMLAAMCIDQFVLDIPFANMVFPLLTACALTLGALQNTVLITAYAVLFELSCVTWFPAELLRVGPWFAEVWVGLAMPFVLCRIAFHAQRTPTTMGFAAAAALGELAYFWVSVVATILLWRVDPAAYIASDLPYQMAGCLATFVCALPVGCLLSRRPNRLVCPRTPLPVELALQA